MKGFLKPVVFGFLFLISSTSAALNPVAGWYAGIMLGGSYSPSIDYVFFDPATGLDQPANLKYSGYGQFGFQAGYRFWENFRVEGELFVNNNPYQTLRFGTTIIKSPKTSTGFRFEGSTTTAALMFNAMYDFFEPNCLTGFAPYVGFGFGYASVENHIKFLFNNVYVGNTRNKERSNGFAGQAVLGAGYFLDDFTWFGLDLRYFVTKQIDILDARPGIPAINERVKFASINLLFSGMFNCA